MKKIMLAILLLSGAAYAGVQIYYPSTTNLGTTAAISCGTGLTCSKVAGKIDMAVTLAGPLAPNVAATATTITAAQCGSTFVNAGAVQINLPKGTTALLGCRLTFITGNASNFDVNPNDADTILALTNAAGDMVRNATVGNAVMIQLISATTWGTVSTTGTWADAN